jgi:hypothetical protein
MSKFTCGGDSPEEALHWCEETYQQLGKIIWSLQSGSETDRVWGRRHYHYLKRMFMREEWDGYIARINTECRIPKGMKTVEELVGESFVPPWSMPEGYEPAAPSEEVAGLHPAARVAPTPPDRVEFEAQGKKIVVEQLSLF